MKTKFGVDPVDAKGEFIHRYKLANGLYKLCDIDVKVVNFRATKTTLVGDVIERDSDGCMSRFNKVSMKR